MKAENTYIVGGFVRDTILNKEPKDIDYVVVGSTPAEMLELGFKKVGADFPVFLHPTSKEEYALARTERKTGSGYKGFKTIYSTDVTLEEDLSRRDLTINSMAMDGSGKIIDPFGGLKDIENKVLKHTTESFIEDPLRVLRIARLLARFGPEWSIHPSTQALIKEIHASGELSELKPQRVWSETQRALMEPNPELYFQTLSGLDLFPELDAMIGIEQPEEHHPEGDVFIHTMLCVKRAADLNFNLETRFGALVHDFGKPVSFHKYGKLAGHEQEGVPIIEEFCTRLKVPKALKITGMRTSNNHGKCHTILKFNPNTLYEFMIDELKAHKDPEKFENFLNACMCDAQGRGPTKVNDEYPQAHYLRKVLKHYLDMASESHEAAHKAMAKGMSGIEIGEQVRNAQISVIKKAIKLATSN